MEKAEIRKNFDEIISRHTDPERIAALELAREYFTNQTFKSALSDMVWEQNNQ